MASGFNTRGAEAAWDTAAAARSEGRDGVMDRGHDHVEELRFMGARGSAIARVGVDTGSANTSSEVGMLVYVWCALGLVALVKGHRSVRRYRRRRAGCDPLSYLLQSRELREFDEHLDRVAEAELRRVETRVSRYVAGLAGHVVVIYESRHGIVLELSDGHQLALGGVSWSTLIGLRRRAACEKLRPAQLERDIVSYRLLLRGEVGADIELRMRRVALTP